MKEFNYKLLGDRVAVQVIDENNERKTSGGIILPSTVENQGFKFGSVVGVSQKIVEESKEYEKVEIGDKVVYSEYAGIDMEIGADKFKILRITDIAAIENEPK